MPSNFSFRGSGFSSLGNSLSSALDSYARLETLESQREYRRENIENFNKWMLEYQNTVNDYVNKFGDRYTTPIIKQKSWQDVSKRAAQSGVNLTDLYSATARMPAGNGVPTLADTVSDIATKLNLTINSYRYANDPEYRDNINTNVLNIAKIKNQTIMEDINDKRALQLSEDYVNSIFGVVATSASTLTQEFMDNINNLSEKQIREKYSSVFNPAIEDLKQYYSSLPQEQREAVGGYIRENIKTLQDYSNTLQNNLMNRQVANMQLQTSKDQFKINKIKNVTEYINSQTQLETALFVKGALKNSEVRNVINKGALFSSAGVNLPSTVAQNMQSIISDFVEKNPNLINNTSKLANFISENSSDYGNIVSILNQGGNLTEENYTDLSNGFLNLYANTIEDGQTYDLGNLTQAEKDQIAGNFVSNYGALNLLINVNEIGQKLSEAAKKYPNNRRIQEALNTYNDLVNNYGNAVKYNNVLEIKKRRSKSNKGRINYDLVNSPYIPWLRSATPRTEEYEETISEGTPNTGLIGKNEDDILEFSDNLTEQFLDYTETLYANFAARHKTLTAIDTLFKALGDGEGKLDLNKIKEAIKSIPRNFIEGYRRDFGFATQNIEEERTEARESFNNITGSVRTGVENVNNMAEFQGEAFRNLGNVAERSGEQLTEIGRGVYESGREKVEDVYNAINNAFNRIRNTDWKNVSENAWNEFNEYIRNIDWQRAPKEYWDRMIEELRRIEREREERENNAE